MRAIRLFFIRLYYKWLMYKLRQRNMPLTKGVKVVILPKKGRENSNYNLRKLGGNVYYRGIVVGFEGGKVDVEWRNLTVAKGHPHKLFPIKRLLRADVIDLAIEVREVEKLIKRYKRKQIINKYKKEYGKEINTKR